MGSFSSSGLLLAKQLKAVETCSTFEIICFAKRIFKIRFVQRNIKMSLDKHVPRTDRPPDSEAAKPQAISDLNRLVIINFID